MSNDGPFLKAAVLCENVIESKQNVLSLINVVDRVEHHAIGPGAPAEMPPLENYRLTAVLMFVSGAARGSHEVGLSIEEPSGLSKPIGTFTMQLEGEDRGANMVLGLGLTLAQQGLYWIDVRMDNALMTRMPLRVIYARQAAANPLTP